MNRVMSNEKTWYGQAEKSVLVLEATFINGEWQLKVAGNTRGFGKQLDDAPVNPVALVNDFTNHSEQQCPGAVFAKCGDRSSLAVRNRFVPVEFGCFVSTHWLATPQSECRLTEKAKKLEQKCTRQQRQIRKLRSRIKRIKRQSKEKTLGWWREYKPKIEKVVVGLILSLFYRVIRQLLGL